jgi:hypothetical protein
MFEGTYEQFFASLERIAGNDYRQHCTASGYKYIVLTVPRFEGGCPLNP